MILLRSSSHTEFLVSWKFPSYVSERNNYIPHSKVIISSKEHVSKSKLCELLWNFLINAVWHVFDNFIEWNIRSEKRTLLLLYPTTHLSRVSYRDVWIGRGCQSNHWIAIFSSAFGRHVVLLLWHLLKRLLRLPILLSVTTTTCLPIGLQLSIFIETKRDMREEE